METERQVPPFEGRSPGWGGFTLLEVVTVVALLGLLLTTAMPAGRDLVDRMAVASAREAVVGIFHDARMEALARGEARIVLVASPPRAELWSAGILRSSTSLDREFGVEMILSRNRDRAELFFDAMGLGRVASQTIRFSRSDAAAGLVVSPLGRVTRQ